MLDRLAVYTRSKYLTIYTAKSGVVHNNSKRGAEIPNFKVVGDALKCSDSFRYLGVHDSIV